MVEEAVVAAGREALAPVVSIFDRRPVAGRELEPWRSKREIARHFGVSTRTVERWVARGMPRTKRYDGGAVRFRVSECEAWLGEVDGV